MRSSELTTVQFSDLMDWEVRWIAMERGLVIEMPDEFRAGAAR